MMMIVDDGGIDGSRVHLASGGLLKPWKEWNGAA